jgi:muramidase (phage lysozyme)
MSFGAEMQDFIKGFKAGSEYWSERAKNRYYESLTAKNRADIERERTPGPADFEAIPDPFNKDGGGGGYTTNPDVQIKDDPEAGKVLGFIRQHEAGDDPYNTLVGGKKANLIGMTVGEVLEYQRNMLKQGHESTALGAYQFINPTLQGLVNDLKLDPNTPFNQQTQDWLGYQLLQKRGWNDYKTGKIDKDKFMDNLAGEWAALPLKTGKSAYEGVGSNKAGVSRDVFSSAVPDFGAGAGAGAQQQGGASSTEQPTQQTRKVYTQPSQGGAIDTSNLQGNLARVVQRAAKDNPNLFAPNPYTYSGRRTPQQQREMVAAGFSPTMHSKHLEGKAMDLVPINPQTGQPDPDYKQGYSNIAKAMFKAAKDEGVDTLKWGGNWKNNPDLPHWQVAWLQQQQEPQEEPQQGATMFAQRGGMIPSGYLPPRTDRLALSAIRRPVPRFQAGGTVPPYVDKYNPSRSYTQPISQTPASTFVPRRVGQAALPGLSTYAPGQPTASQLTFRNYQASALARQQAADALKAQQAAQAAAAAQAAQQAAAEAAARRAAAARRDRPVGYQGGSGRSQQGGVSAGYGGYGGSGTRSGGVSSGGRGLWAEGGMVPETKYATGGAVDEVDWRKVRDRIDPYGYMRPEYENPNMRGGYTYEEGTPY